MVSTGLHSLLGTTNESVKIVIDLIPAPVFVTDLDGVLIDCNQSFLDFFQLDDEALGKPLNDAIPPELARQLQGLRQTDKAEEMQTLEADFLSVQKLPRSVRIQYCPFENQMGTRGGVVGLIIDITEESKKVDRLRQLSILDELTSLPNRRHGLERVQNLLQQSQRNEFSFSFLILDIDSFKTVNDYEGHQAGDTVLKEIAEIIQELCRSYDLAFRYGGDEFIICLPNTGPDAAAIFGERIREAIQMHGFVLQDGARINTSVSIGISNFPDDGENLEQLLTAADTALYYAKQQGRNRVVSASLIKANKVTRGE